MHAINPMIFNNVNIYLNADSNLNTYKLIGVNGVMWSKIFILRKICCKKRGYGIQVKFKKIYIIWQTV